jgi:glycosyltransferase involved in cell wall biosynthesis
MDKLKLVRITTVPVSLDKLLTGQLAYMNQFYNVIGISSDASYLEKVGRKEKIEVKCIEMTRKITPFKDLVSVYKLYFFLKKEKPFIVHTHTPKAGTVGMLAAKLAGVPHRLHTIAGLPLMEAVGAKRKLLNLVEKFTYTCATKIYPNSFGLKDIILQEEFCKLDKLKVIGNGSSNGIDTNYFSPEAIPAKEKENLKNQLHIQPTDFVFIFVGRLVGDKGINEMVEAFGKLEIGDWGFGNGIKLLLVGPFETELDPLKTETLKAIETNPNIIAVGFQQEVRSYFAIADALVFPSYREGFPNVVLQAGAMELPSIVSNINGCNEIIKDDYNGLIIPAKDSNAVYEAMKKMVENTPLYQKLKAKSRKRIVDNYEQKVVWNAILNEYKKLEENV